MPVHGKKGVFKLDNSAGVLTDISVKCTNVSLPESMDNPTVTTFTKTAQTRVSGLADGNIEVSIMWDATIDAHIRGVIAALKAGTITSVSFEHGPEGSTTGLRKSTGESLIASYEVDTPVDGPITASLSLECSDDITHGTYV